MAMKKKLFSSIRKKSSGGGSTQDNQETGNTDTQSLRSTTSTVSSDKKDERPPSFQNLDVDDSKSMKTFQYSYNSNTNSLFSDKHTMSTGFSSRPSTTSSYGKKQQQVGSSLDETNRQTFTSIGRPLRVLHEEEFEEDEENPDDKAEEHLNAPPRTSFNRRKSNMSEDSTSILTDRSVLSHAAGEHQLAEYELQQLKDFILRQLKVLSTSISNTLIQVSQSVLNLTRASITISESIKNSIQVLSSHKHISYLPSYSISTISSVDLRTLIKNTLYLIDNLLVSRVYDNSKALVLKNLFDLLLKLKLTEPSLNYGLENYITMMSPKLFPIGSTYADFPKQDTIPRIMTSLISKSKEGLLSDQEGSFIAPVLRGFLNENLSVITFIFGFAEITREHLDIINYFSSNSEDLHFLAQKNSIQQASTASSVPPATRRQNAASSAISENRGSQQKLKFKAPFRTLDGSTNPDYIPISMSLACNNALTLSGTLGGYLYPRIPKNNKNPKLQRYANSIFGLTCAHVVLNEDTVSDGSSDSYPFVSVPSPVLINMYKNALSKERLKYKVTSEEFKAYDGVVKRIDELYPISDVKIKNKLAKRNLPVQQFGQIVWGERVINADKLSDIAIIKIIDNQQKSRKYLNYLGDDLNLEQYDPSLMFSNLYVKKTLSLKDKTNGLLNFADLDVFKVGSTTNYTSGRLNGIKLIYWSDGSLKTSEFIISASCSGDSATGGSAGSSSTGSGSSGNTGNMNSFAAGGDSGSLILAKLSDVSTHHYHDINNSNTEQNVVAPRSARKSMFTSFLETIMPSATGQTQPAPSTSTVTRQQTLDNNNNQTGLAAIGMLHSYDGEFKQFGLFTPIDNIMDRLQQVTGIQWGVVGCSDDDEVSDSNSSEEDGQGGDEDDEDEDEDDVESYVSSVVS